MSFNFNSTALVYFNSSASAIFHLQAPAYFYLIASALSFRAYSVYLSKTNCTDLMAKIKKAPSNTIANNKKARFDFFIEEDFEAGLALEGWEVKSMRAGRVQLTESYITVHNGELYLYGAHISPLISASTHITPNPIRNRKLLLKRLEISRLIEQVDRDGYTIAPLTLYWVRGRAKLKIGLAKGKKQHDKRASIKERDWKRDQQRLMKGG